MASTYVNDLRLNELATGDGSGTWGTTTNTNLELIAEGLSFGTEGITTNADTHTSTVADGATDPARSMFIKYTGTLDSACTITIAPNTLSRVHFIENGTSGSQNIIISQGSGANVTIPPGDVKVVYLDGAGSGAAVVDAFASLSVVDLKVQDDLTVTGDVSIGDDLTLASDSAVLNFGADSDINITHVHNTGLTTNGDFSVGDDLLLNSDSAVLSIGADADLKITHDGTNGDFESAGNLTFDIAGDINLDADGGEVNFQDGGTTIAYLGNSSTDLLLGVSTSDKDLYIQGNDGGSTINALHLDMSAAGYATFNNGGRFADTLQAPYIFGRNDSDTGISFGENGANIMQIYTANAERIRIDENGLVGIGTTPAVPLHVKASAPGFALQTSGSMTSGNRADFSAFNSDAGTVGLIRFGAVTDNVGTNVQFYSRPAGGSLTQFMRITSVGQIRTINRDFGFSNHLTTVSLADDASIVINAGTAGVGLLAIYETASGGNALFRAGYLSCAALSGAGGVTFAAADTDGAVCVFSTNHTITIKNRLGATKAFYINMFMAGNNFAG